MYNKSSNVAQLSLVLAITTEIIASHTETGIWFLYSFLRNCLFLRHWVYNM